MRRSFSMKNRIFFIAFMILVILAACTSPYYTTSVLNNNFRVRKSDEYQSMTENYISSSHAMSMGTCLIQKSVYIQSALEDILLFILGNKLVMFFILPVLFAFNQLFLFIKRRNILISQMNNKIYIVQYLQLKDGKKRTQSFMYSF